MAKNQLPEVEGVEPIADAWLEAKDTVNAAEARLDDAAEKIRVEVESVALQLEREGIPQSSYLVRATNGRKIEMTFTNRPVQLKDEDILALRQRLGPYFSQLVEPKLSVTLEGEVAQWALDNWLKALGTRPDIKVKTTQQVVSDFRARRLEIRKEASGDVTTTLEAMERTAMAKPSMKAR